MAVMYRFVTQEWKILETSDVVDIFPVARINENVAVVLAQNPT